MDGQTDGQTEGRWTTGDQKSSLELTAQVSQKEYLKFSQNYMS